MAVATRGTKVKAFAQLEESWSTSSDMTASYSNININNCNYIITNLN